MQHLTEKKVKVCPNGFHNNKDSECTCGEKIKNTKWATTKETITECNGLFLPESKTETINYLASMSVVREIIALGNEKIEQSEKTGLEVVKSIPLNEFNRFIEKYISDKKE